MADKILGAFVVRFGPQIVHGLSRLAVCPRDSTWRNDYPWAPEMLGCETYTQGEGARTRNVFRGKLCTVKTKNLNLRSGPNSASPVVEGGPMPQGKDVEIVDIQVPWVKIRVKGEDGRWRTGFAHGNYSTPPRGP